MTTPRPEREVEIAMMVNRAHERAVEAACQVAEQLGGAEPGPHDAPRADEVPDVEA